MLQNDNNNFLIEFGASLYSYQYDPVQKSFVKNSNNHSYRTIKCMTKIASFLEAHSIGYSVDSNGTFILEI